MPPLREEQVHDVEIFRCRLRDSALCREEMDVRVAAEKPLAIKVLIPFDTQSQFPLSRLDLHHGPEGLVFISARDIYDHLSARQPALALAVHISVGYLAEPH